MFNVTPFSVGVRTSAPVKSAKPRFGADQQGKPSFLDNDPAPPPSPKKLGKKRSLSSFFSSPKKDPSKGAEGSTSTREAVQAELADQFTPQETEALRKRLEKANLASSKAMKSGTPKEIKDTTQEFLDEVDKRKTYTANPDSHQKLDEAKEALMKSFR